MAIEFYFDFASPYGFIAAMQMDRIAEPVSWHPFLLGAVYKAVGQSPLDHPMKRAYVINVDAPRMARLIGLDLKVPEGFPEHALPPARTFYWIDAQAPDKAVAFAKLAYRRYWLDGCSTADARVASDAAAALGFDGDAVATAKQAPAAKDRLVRANDAAVANGVFGSPFFLVDGEPYWGSDRLDLLARRPEPLAYYNKY
jgi:2-hydroxychromene-2-carboxylate isomerase